MNWTTLFAVAIGGAMGASMRYGLHIGLSAWHGAETAWSTLVINVLGSFALGLAATLLAARTGVIPPFVMVGVLGAFTTFSTFALDASGLFRDRGLVIAAVYIGLSVGLSLIGFVVGALSGRVIL